MEFQYKTRGEALPYGKSRIYFACYFKDFEKTFQVIANDILNVLDCAIYYDVQNSINVHDINEEELERMNLIVVPITRRFLTNSNIVSEYVLPFAKKEHIPILPIIMESGIESIYQSDILLGNLQYLDRIIQDDTQITYEEKLKRYLQAVIISDEQAERIRAAFDAYIFLSYRKKDRHYANELMHLIHKNPLCRDMAIWYDEYLIPGENYNDTIAESLKKSDCFALLITPNLVNEDNYVCDVEYPAAQELGKVVLPIEMADTDYKRLKERFENIPHCVNGNDKEALNEEMTQIFSELALRKNDQDPIHNFLIGLAYLEGIDVEVDRERAIELIMDSANSGLPEAMKKLRDMYWSGTGVNVDFNKAIQWGEKLVDKYLEMNGVENSDTLVEINNIAMLYQEVGNLIQCKELLDLICPIAMEVLGIEDDLTISLVCNWAYIQNLEGDYEDAIETYTYLISIAEKVYGKYHANTLRILNNYASCCYLNKELDKAQEIYEYVYYIRRKIYGRDHWYTLNTLHNLAMIIAEKGDFQKAFSIEEEIYECSRRSLGEKNRDTLKALQNLAIYAEKLERIEDAALYWNKCYELQNQLFNNKHPEVLETLEGLGRIAVIQKRYGDAVDYYGRLYDLYCEINGSTDVNALRSVKNKAYSYYCVEEYNVAIEILEKTCEDIKEITEDNICVVSEILNSLAVCYFYMGEYAKAETIFNRLSSALCVFYKENPILSNAVEEPIKKVAEDMLEMAFELSEIGELEKAAALFGMVYELLKQWWGQENQDTLIALSKSAYYYEEIGEHQRAIEAYETLYRIQNKILGETHEDTLKTLHNLAYSYESAGELGKMVSANEKVYLAYLEKNGCFNSETLTALNALAFGYRKTGDFSKAAALFEKGYAACRNNAGDTHPVTLKMMFSLADIQIELGNLEYALELFEKLYSFYEEILGENHKNTLIVKKKIYSIRKIMYESH